MRLGHNSSVSAKLHGGDLSVTSAAPDALVSAHIAQPELADNRVRPFIADPTTARIGRRLRDARLRAGYTSAATFARAHGLPLSTYHHHENGRRGIDNEWAHFYARTLNISVAELIDVNELPVQRSLFIVGSIYENGRTKVMRDSNADRAETVIDFMPRTVEIPDITQMHPWRVEDNSMLPVYRMGDTIFHRHPVYKRNLLRRLHGEECLVELDGGEKLLRQVTMGVDGLATLISYSGPAMHRVTIVSAAFVAVVMRAGNPLL